MKLLFFVCFAFLLMTCSNEENGLAEKGKPYLSAADSAIFDSTTFYDSSVKIPVNRELAGKDNIIAIMNEIFFMIQSKDFALEFIGRESNTNGLLDSMAESIILKHGFESVRQYESAFNDLSKSK